MGNWRYRIEQSSDGAKLIEAYKEVDEILQNSLGKEDEETDFIVYLEDNYSVSFGILLVKMSQAMVNYTLDNSKKDLIGFWSREIVKEQYQLENHAFRATAKDLHNAFLTELSINGKRESGVLGKNAAEDVQNLLKGFSDWIRAFKFTREQYDPILKSSKYLLKNYNKVFDLFDQGLDVVINSLQVFKERLVTAKVFVRASKYFDGRFFDLMLQFVEAYITFFLRLKTFLKTIQKISTKGFAFLCGIINGIIEFLAGIADIIFVIIEGIIYGIFESNDEIMLDYLLLRESLENFAEKLIDEPDFLVKAIQKAVENYVDKRYRNEELNDYEIAYNSGEDIIIVVDVVVSVLTLVKGVPKLAKALKGLDEWINKLLKRKGKGSNKLKNRLQKIRKVIYGESELSKKAIEFRKKLGNAKRHNGNVAVFEYFDKNGKLVTKEFTTQIGDRRHAEEFGIEWFKKNNIPEDNIQRVYSELEPCSLGGHNCKEQLTMFKNADIEYSFDYPGDNLIGKEVRKESIKQRSKLLEKILK